MGQILRKIQIPGNSMRNPCTGNAKLENPVNKSVNIHDVIKPLYYVSKPVCLWPYEYETKTELIRPLSRTTKLIYYIFSASVTLYIIFVSLKPFFTKLQNSCTALIITDVATILSSYICGTLSTILCTTKSGRLSEKFFLEVQNLGALELFNPTFTRYNLKRKLMLNTVIVILIAISFYSLDVFIYVKAFGFLEVLTFANFYVTQYQLVTVILHLQCKAEILFQYFRCLNEKLKTCISPGNRCRSDLCSNSSKNCYLNEVINMKQIHGKLCNLMKLSNKAHGWQSIVLIVTLIALLLNYLYFGTTATTKEFLKNQDILTTLRFWQFGSFTFCGSIAVLLAAKCSSATQQAQKASFLINDALLQIENDLTDKHVEIYREELQQFIDQVSFRNPHFSAAGLFKLDFSIIYTIIGAVTSNYIVFLQFRDSPNCAVGNFTNSN